jgi:predicted transcriptional regulator
MPSAELSTKTLSLVLFMFTAVTLTHAALVDYRSGAAETQPQFKAMQENKMANQMLYLQTRKLAGAELLVVDIGASDKRGIWRGLIKSKWTENGLCCGVFELLLRMKGGRTRTMILKSLLKPKNKLQLSHELGIDWKAVDGHMVKLLQYGLATEIMAVGTCKVYAITQKGRRALELVQKWQEPDSVECERQKSLL